MRFMIVGCGFIGEPLRQQLLSGGHEVIGLTLSGADGTEACDISVLEALEGLAGRVGGFDAIVHCAASGRGVGDRVERYRCVYLEGSQNLLTVFPSAVLLFTSSTSVYAQTDGEVVDECSPAEPAAETGKILRASEDLVLTGGGVVIRLAGIYGPGRSFLLKRFLEGAAQIDGRWINQIHRDDAASAIACLLEHAGGPDGVFNVADNTPLRQIDCYTELSERFGKPLPPEGTPDPGRKRGWTNKRVSNEKLRALGWKPQFPSYYDALDGDPALIPSILETL